MSQQEDRLKDQCSRLSILYLEKVLDIEKVFIRNIVYLSLASIVVSLFFLKESSLSSYSGLCFLFISWGLHVTCIACGAVMVFCSALFKDLMFGATFRNSYLYEPKLLDQARSSKVGFLVYWTALFCAVFFILALISLLVFMGVNIVQDV